MGKEKGKGREGEGEGEGKGKGKGKEKEKEKGKGFYIIDNPLGKRGPRRFAREAFKMTFAGINPMKLNEHLFGS